MTLAPITSISLATILRPLVHILSFIVFLTNVPSPASFIIYFRFLQTNICTILHQYMLKMSSQYPVPGFEPPTCWTRVSSHNHQKWAHSYSFFIYSVSYTVRRPLFLYQHSLYPSNFFHHCITFVYPISLSLFLSLKLSLSLSLSQCDQMARIFVQYLAIYSWAIYERFWQQIYNKCSPNKLADFFS